MIQNADLTILVDSTYVHQHCAQSCMTNVISKVCFEQIKRMVKHTFYLKNVFIVEKTNYAQIGTTNINVTVSVSNIYQAH